MRLIKPKPLTT